MVLNALGAALAARGLRREVAAVVNRTRVVASPEPLEILDAAAIRCPVDAGMVTVCNGGEGSGSCETPRAAYTVWRP